MNSFKNIIFDTDYTLFVVWWWFPHIETMQLTKNNIKQQETTEKQQSQNFFQKIMEFLVPWPKKESASSETTKEKIHINQQPNGTLKKDTRIIRLQTEQYA